MTINNLTEANEDTMKSIRTNKEKVKTLAKLLFVPGSIWKALKKSEREAPPLKTEREKEEHDALLPLGQAGALYLEFIKGSAYLAGAGVLLYPLIK